MDELQKKLLLKQAYESAQNDLYNLQDADHIRKMDKEYYNAAVARPDNRYTVEQKEMLGGADLDESEKVKRSLALEKAMRELGIPAYAPMNN